MNNSNQMALTLIAAIDDVLNNEENDNHISLKEEDLTDFIYALSVLMPAYTYRALTGDEQDNLGFNHLSNRLCHQYSKDKEQK